MTEFPFTLPHGYVDADGTVHREGAMRLATAFDEITPGKDPRVQANPAYLLVILLSRVITRLGAIELISPKVVEGLFAGDLDHLQQLYRRINRYSHDRVTTTCPHCEETYETEVSRLGG
jgi:phage FluMu protein gp41